MKYPTEDTVRFTAVAWNPNLDYQLATTSQQNILLWDLRSKSFVLQHSYLILCDR